MDDVLEDIQDNLLARCPVFAFATLADLSKEVEAGRTPEQVVGNIAAKTPETGSVVSLDHWHLRLADLDGYQIEIERRPYIAQGRRFQVAGTARFLKILRKWLLSQDGNKEALGLIFASRGDGGSSEGEADQ